MNNEKEWHQKIEGMILKSSGLELELVWIPKIMAKQTSSEVQISATKEKNLVGLCAYDAPIISSFYHQIQDGKHLSIKQTEVARKKLSHYWKQYAGMMVNITTRASVS